MTDLAWIALSSIGGTVLVLAWWAWATVRSTDAGGNNDA